MKTLNLYLVRHGQTQWNIEEKMQGSKNSPLTEEGISSAKKLGESLQNTPFIAAYSSPQERAVKTRDYILSASKQTVETHELAGLKEMDFGDWEGEHVPSKLRHIPSFQQFLTEPAHFDATGNKGENYFELLERMKQSIDQIVKDAKQDEGNILVVSHGTALRVLLCVLNGGELAKHRDDSYFPRILNTSVSKVSCKLADGNLVYQVEYFNKTL